MELTVDYTSVLENFDGGEKKEEEEENRNDM